MIAYLRFFGGKAAAPAFNRTATSKDEILKALADSYDYGEALIREQTDQSMLQIIETNQYLGPSSKARVIYFLIGHTWDIYGQMVVYLAPERHHPTRKSATLTKVSANRNSRHWPTARYPSRTGRWLGAQRGACAARPNKPCAAL